MASMGWLVGAAIVSTGVSVGEDIMKSDQASQMEQKQEDAIKLQESRAKTQADAQQISRDKQQSAIIGQQKAMAAARGMSESSGSFQASVLGSDSRFQEASKLGNISLSMSLDNMESQIDQARQKESAEQMGDMFDIGKSIFGGISDASEINKGNDHFSSSVPDHLRSADSWMKESYNTDYNARNNIPTFGSE
jgi:hypothetical protein